jgi:predicted esterase
VSGRADFVASRARLLDLYAQDRYPEALDLALGAVARFPDHGAEVRYWEACMRAADGDTEGALAALREGLDRGMWWRPEFVQNDPDLRRLGGRPEFDDLVEESARRASAAAAAGMPTLRILRPSTPTGVLVVALHGGSGNAEDLEPHWAPATAGGATVALPQSSIPAFSDGGEFWWGAPEEAANEVAGHVESILASEPVDPNRIVLSGFSQGAGVALWCAVRGVPVAARGVVSVGSGGPTGTGFAAGDLDAAGARGLRVWFLTGDRDFSRHRVEDANEDFSAHGIESRLTVEPGVGHAVPPGFADRVPEMLAWVTGEGDRGATP